VEGEEALSTLERGALCQLVEGNIRAGVSPDSIADAVSFDASGRPRPTAPNQDLLEEHYG
jgi:hypothetical protein